MGGEPVAHKRRVLLRGASSYHQNFDSEEQAEELEQYIHWIIDVDEASMTTDLLSTSLGRVDWHEIARSNQE
jgi:hypothetical protein